MSASWKIRQVVRVTDLDPAWLEAHDVEIWEGELLEISPAGKRHNWLAEEIFHALRNFTRKRRDLVACGDNHGFLVEQDPDTLISPDAALVRLRPEDKDGPWHHYAPELSVEVLSPSNNEAEMAAKRRILFRHGCQQFWILDATARRLTIHFSDGRVMEATGGVVTGEGIVDGLALDLDELFDQNPYAL